MRQAVMAVANMVEALLRGGCRVDALAEDHVESSDAAGDCVPAPVDGGAGPQEPESTSRQYGLATTAAELGWLAEQIVIVDADLGVSGRFGSERDGYRDIVARLCMGEVGAVLAWRSRGWAARMPI